MARLFDRLYRAVYMSKNELLVVVVAALIVVLLSVFVSIYLEMLIKLCPYCINEIILCSSIINRKASGSA